MRLKQHETTHLDEILKEALEKWSKLPLNGRQVYNCLEAATALAKSEHNDPNLRVVLTEANIEDSLKMIKVFRRNYMGRLSSSHKVERRPSDVPSH